MSVAFVLIRETARNQQTRLLVHSSDVLWWCADGKQLYTHANRWAPRCLPCTYTDPAEQGFQNMSDQHPAPRVSWNGAAIILQVVAIDAHHIHCALLNVREP